MFISKAYNKMLTELISRYDTIGHRTLDLEAELGIDTEPYKETLDRLIEEARARIQVKDTYTGEDAVGILRTIDSILQDNGFEQRDEKEFIDGLHLFHEGLGSKKIDCDNSSFVYLSIAEALNLPLAAVNAPRHTFVRFILDGNSFNWETTSAMERSNDFYINRSNISDESIRNGVYLRNLTREETFSNVYGNRGNAWFRKGNLDNAIVDYNEAIRLDPNYAIAYNNRGIAWVGKGNLDRAINDHHEAISLDPNLVSAYYNRGNAWARKSELGKAIADYNEAIRLNPNFAEAYYNRGNAWADKGNLDEAIADYDKAIGLNPNYAKAYNNRGIAWVGKGSLEEAIKDYNKAIELNPNYDMAYYNRGNARLRKHQYAGALLDFARAKLTILR